MVNQIRLFPGSSTKLLPPLLLATALLCSSPGSRAASIVHFQPAAGPHNYLKTDHPAVLDHLVPSVWVLSSYAKDPLVYRDSSGLVSSKIVEHALTADAAFAIGLFDRFELGAALPVVFVNGPGFDGGGLSATTLGDLRLLGKVLLTPWNEGLVASIRARADMPLAQLTPDAAELAGDSGWPNVTPAFGVGYNSEFFRVGFDLGYLVRSPSNLGSLKIGHEVLYGLGGELMVVEQTLYATVDLFGRAAPQVINSLLVEDASLVENHFPLELAAALKYFMGPMVVVGGLGSGVIPDYGSPLFRVFIGLGYYPRPDGDRDGDGFSDSMDQCPDQAEVRNGLRDHDGCPDQLPVDTDGDGFLDPDDACPEEPEDKDGFEDDDGCPDDNDGDGIADKQDKCPDIAEDIDQWQDEDGCPELDNDEDKILDHDDACPNDPETYNGRDDTDGCPDKKSTTVIVKRERVEIKDKIHFAYDSDRILPVSFALLDSVAMVIQEHQEINLISIDGHTDYRGSDIYNRDLSQRRANAVRRYLINAGVKAERLTAKGYGESVPIATNETEAGRSQNRRVEFKIVVTP